MKNDPVNPKVLYKHMLKLLLLKDLHFGFVKLKLQLSSLFPNSQIGYWNSLWYEIKTQKTTQIQDGFSRFSSCGEYLCISN